MSADNAYAVELKGLTFKRGTRSIFNNVDIRIPRGKVTGIMRLACEEAISSAEKLTSSCAARY